MRVALDANTRRPSLQPGGRTFVLTEGADLRKLAKGVPVVEVVPILSPWRVSIPHIFTPTSKTDYTLPQKKLFHKAIASVVASFLAAHRLYVDRSL